MQSKSAVALADKSFNPDRRPEDYLSLKQIELQYPDTVQAQTLAVWACTRRYNFHVLITKIGRNSRVRRDRWERFLDSRTVGIAMEIGQANDPG